MVEQQPIATVGISDTFKPKDGPAVIFDGTDTSRSHLHFEVSRKKYFKAAGLESQIDHLPTLLDERREDPLLVLEMLGPWGPKQLSFPGGQEVNEKKLVALHAEVEGGAGGYFPLGSKNLWHGGVHLPIAEGSKVVAPFDGVIVAARLDPDPDSNEGHDRERLSPIAARRPAWATFRRSVAGKPPTGCDHRGRRRAR